MSYCHLTESHRRVIADMHRANHGPRAIGRALGRHHSTISRELSRNAPGADYNAEHAQRLAVGRLKTPRQPDRMAEARLQNAVRAMLSEDWSPEIISAQLRLKYPDDAAMRISHESLYRWIYRQIEAGEFKPDCLWRPRKARQSRHSRKPPHSRIPGRVDIEQRPEVVAERSRVGDWEGDSVVSAKNRGGVATFVERTTRFTIAGHLPDKQASTFAKTAQDIFGWVPESLCQTATLDNGTEMAAHAHFSQPKSMDIYFAHPHAPWQRGANEQVNGLLRHYFPKGTDFSKVASAELDVVILKINKRPRKCQGESLLSQSVLFRQ
jgi:IS30 family transposase